MSVYNTYVNVRTCESRRSPLQGRKYHILFYDPIAIHVTIIIILLLLIIFEKKMETLYMHNCYNLLVLFLAILQEHASILHCSDPQPYI